MNKYEMTLHSFCDACFSQKSCKGTCKRMSDMEKFINKYENLARAFDNACAELSIGTHFFNTMTKDEVKEYFLKCNTHK